MPSSTPPPLASAAIVQTPIISAAYPPPPPQSIVAPVHPPARVALLVLVVSDFPVWWPFLVASYERNAPTYQLICVHTEAKKSSTTATSSAAAGDGHVRYEHVPLPNLKARFVEKLGATQQQVDNKFASGKGLSDLKPLYGRIFDDFLPEGQYTHWGWVDWDLLLGDLSAVISERLLWEYDALTFPGATLGFAWAGQLSILRNTAPDRTLYTVVADFLALSFKTGTGEARQSGWEERVLLRETLKRRPQMSILFHMAAQFDYKAQWLTWVPFDHFWDFGKIWRCAKYPLSRPGRPPLLVSNHSKWLLDVAQIQSAPHAYQARTDGRICVRWDLESSPWRCCPHSTGVGYVAVGSTLSPQVLPFANASQALRARLASAAKSAAVRPRESAYDVCQEGAFFHAGLVPKGGIATKPSCTRGTWALQDDIGRFSGSLTLLAEECR